MKSKTLSTCLTCYYFLDVPFEKETGKLGNPSIFGCSYVRSTLVNYFSLLQSELWPELQIKEE